MPPLNIRLVWGTREWDCAWEWSVLRSVQGEARWAGVTRIILDIQGLVARQSDWALFTLGLNLAKSTSLNTRKKEANHSP
jgi:hypothetical protein